MNIEKIFALLAINFCVLMSCDYESSQQIISVFHSDKEPVNYLQINIASGDYFERCEKAQLSGVTNNDGVIKFQRTIIRSRIDPYVQQDSLCIYSDNEWKVAWKSTYGPAPKTMEFSCINHSGEEWKCTMNKVESDS